MPSGNELIFMNPGSFVTVDERGNSADSGVITGWVDGVSSVADLWTADAAMPTSLPGGSGVPLIAQTKRLMGNGVAKVVARYGRPSSNFMPRVQIDPVTSYVAQLWADKDGNAIRDPQTGEWVPRRVAVPCERISYYTRKYSWSAAHGSWNNAHKGKVCSSAYTIEDQTYGAFTLRFDGYRVRHYQWGAYNIYDMRFDFMHRPDMWVEQFLDDALLVQTRDQYPLSLLPALPT